ncbi:hypothetical protein CBR_g32265 [Chara braunii]|uniref:Ty3 transposon capsid-like protein domain-containing protein n=1 Tax=Chara braunii TaxID=69332 RepID=A0A388JN54_CHABU|nr:hypothetical protein CBR_g32265 [Chara braunii]|eukprot:GBG59249.1 hypothetical protein CBR_g32265 [Chara braunii]
MEQRTRAQIEARRGELGELLSQLLVDMEFAVPTAREHIRGKFDLEAISDHLAKATTGVEMVAAATEIQKVIGQCREILDQFTIQQLEEIAQWKDTVPEVKVESIEENIQQLKETLAKEERKWEELLQRKEQETRLQQRMGRVQQHVSLDEKDVAQTLGQILTYLTFLEEKLDQQQSRMDEFVVGLHVITSIVKGKAHMLENDEEKKDKERRADVKPEKLLIGGMKNGDTTKKETVKETEKKPEEKKPEEKKPEEKKPEEKKPDGNDNGDGNGNGNGNGNGGPSGPTPSQDNAKPADPTKSKKKEKVKMKLSFTFSNKKEESLPLWIAEIQTYVGTAPVEEESQVAFTTSCMGGEVKQWVLAEANAAGFDDIGDWAKTMTLKQFLAKVKDRFLEKTTADKAFDQLTTIGQRSWSSVESLSREVDRLLQVRGLNLQDSRVLYIYLCALPEPIRGHLVAEAKSGKYSYRQFRDLALQWEQITSQVKGSYAAAVKNGGGSSRGGYGKRVIWCQKRQDHTLVVFDDDTMEKWPLENEGGRESNSDHGKGEVTPATVNKGGPSSNT